MSVCCPAWDDMPPIRFVEDSSPTPGCIGKFESETGRKQHRPGSAVNLANQTRTPCVVQCPRLVGAPGVGGTQGPSCKGALGAGCWRGKARGLVERCTREGERIAWRGHGARVGRLLHPRVGHRVGGRLVTWDPHRTPCPRGSRSRSADARRRRKVSEECLRWRKGN